MVCKKNGQDAKDTVVLKGHIEKDWETGESKKPCNEISFSRNVATGGVSSYNCYEYKNINGDIRKWFVYSFNKEDFAEDPTRIIIPQIPVCFEEVPLEK